MPRSDAFPPPDTDGTPTADAMPGTRAPVSRRKFLAQVAAAAAAAPALGALAASAATPAPHDAHGARKRTPAPPPAAKPAGELPAAPSGARPDLAVARTPAEREALEKQWKQMVDLVVALRKTPVPVGAEFATGALAPRRLRREAN